MEENQRLRQQVANISPDDGGNTVAAESENIVYDEGQSSESINATSNSLGPPQDSDSSDTSLKLGWAFFLIFLVAFIFEQR